jgi:DDE superfamily endonuclease
LHGGLRIAALLTTNAASSGFVVLGVFANEFFRHREIYQSDVGLWREEQPVGRSPIHRLDEFPAGYSLAGCSPALPASASPVEIHSAAKWSGRSRIFQRTANSVLTHCLTLGDKRNCPPKTRGQLKPKGSTWHMNETLVRIAGRWMYLFRAVDSTGQTVDFYLSET